MHMWGKFLDRMLRIFDNSCGKPYQRAMNSHDVCFIAHETKLHWLPEPPSNQYLPVGMLGKDNGRAFTRRSRCRPCFW